MTRRRRRVSDVSRPAERAPSLWVLAGLLALGAALRFSGLDFGLPGKYRPDEEFVVSRALGALGGELNPHFFQYPTLYIYLLTLVLAVWRTVGGWLGTFGAAGFDAFVNADGGAPAYLLARETTAVLGVVGLWAVYRLGRTAFGPGVGLLAAALLTFNYTHVRESHFGVTDVAMTLLATLALTALVRVSQRGRLGDSVEAGILCGLAFSTKYPALALLVPLGLAHLFPWRGGRGVARGALAVGLMAVFFLVGSPYVVLDFKSFRAAMVMESTFTGGLDGLDAPHGLTWLFGFALRYGAGVLVTGAALAGAVWVIHEARRDPRLRGGALVLLGFVVAVITPFVLSRLVYLRYALPILPVVMVLAAVLIDRAARRVWPARATALAWVVVVLASLDPALRAVRTDRLLRGPDTRNLARAFIAAQVPVGSTIAANTYYAYPKPELPPGYSWVDFGMPAGESASWVWVEEHPLAFFSPPPPPQAQARIDAHGQLAAVFDPFVPGGEATAVFDPGDAFYVPVAGHGSVTQAGPRLKIYRMGR